MTGTTVGSQQICLSQQKLVVLQMIKHKRKIYLT